MIKLVPFVVLLMVLACSKSQNKSDKEPPKSPTSSVEADNSIRITIDSLIGYLELANYEFHDSIFFSKGLRIRKGEVLSYFVRMNEPFLVQMVLVDGLYSFRTKNGTFVYFRFWKFADEEAAHSIAERLSRESDGDGPPFKEPHLIFVLKSSIAMIFVDSEGFRSELDGIRAVPLPPGWIVYELH